LPFDSKVYGSRVAQILALDQDGNALMPLVSGGRDCASKQARALLSGQTASALFARAQSPEAALAGVWLYFSESDECHSIVQDLASPEGSFWHAILHRREPDAANSAYWFRALGRHPLFPELGHEAAEIVRRHPDLHFDPDVNWDPFQFIEFCELARRQPGSAMERAALEIQRAEWQLLFDYCARAGS
jgi:hypothetical protein